LSSTAQFELLAQEGSARRGRLHLPHGTVETPVFMPVGTYGSVKGMTPEELEGLGAEIILGNTFHLMLRPGAEIVGRAPRIHGLAAIDPHRFGRLPGLQPEGHAADR
jgi:queuine tRNA-ribosyltransferase